MTLSERVFQYCERGTNEALWAEPINAITNAGFILAALIFWQLMLWRPREQRNADHYLLMTLVFLIGFGSLAFHLYANRITELADVIPIGLFMLVYLGFALNRFVGLPPGWTVLFVIAFAALMSLAVQVKCWDGGIGLLAAPEEAGPCMNGSVGYLPALGALIIVGMILGERRHRAAPYVLAAAVTFIVSIILRSLDFALCDLVVIEGRDVGTHFMWHLLNAVVLFLLLRASLETGTKPAPAAAAAVPAETEHAAGDAETGEAASKDAASEDTSSETAPEEAEASGRPEEDGELKDKTEVEDVESDKPKKTPDAEESAAPREATPEGQDEQPKRETEPKNELESETETDSKPDEAEKEEVKTEKASDDTAKETSKPEASEPEPSESETSKTASPEDTSEDAATSEEDKAAEPDKATTEEDVAKAVKALSTEAGEGAEKSPARKRSTRRRKWPSSD